MAAGETYVLDDAQVLIGATSATTPISGYCAQAMVHFEYPETPTPHTFGQAGQVTSISNHYSVTVTLDLVTDDYAAGNLDKIFRELMPEPMGGGNGVAAISISPNTSSPGTAANPTFAGNIIISQWEPLGGGTVGQPVRQSRTFNGTGNWSRDDT